jgi:hypothetical protein
MTRVKSISVTNPGNNNFTIHQGLTYIAGITPAWIRYSAPALFNDTAELHRLITAAYTKVYAGRDAVHISIEEKNALNSLALETFRKTARQKSTIAHILPVKRTASETQSAAA